MAIRKDITLVILIKIVMKEISRMINSMAKGSTKSKMATGNITKL